MMANPYMMMGLQHAMMPPAGGMGGPSGRGRPFGDILIYLY